MTRRRSTALSGPPCTRRSACFVALDLLALRHGRGPRRFLLDDLVHHRPPFCGRSIWGGPGDVDGEQPGHPRHGRITVTPRCANSPIDVQLRHRRRRARPCGGSAATGRPPRGGSSSSRAGVVAHGHPVAGPRGRSSREITSHHRQPRLRVGADREADLDAPPRPRSERTDDAAQVTAVPSASIGHRRRPGGELDDPPRRRSGPSRAFTVSDRAERSGASSSLSGSTFTATTRSRAPRRPRRRAGPTPPQPWTATHSPARPRAGDHGPVGGREAAAEAAASA